MKNSEVAALLQKKPLDLQGKPQGQSLQAMLETDNMQLKYNAGEGIVNHLAM